MCFSLLSEVCFCDTCTYYCRRCISWFLIHRGRHIHGFGTYVAVIENTRQSPQVPKNHVTAARPQFLPLGQAMVVLESPGQVNRFAQYYCTLLCQAFACCRFLWLFCSCFGKHPNCISREETRPSATRSAKFCYWNRSLGFCFFSRLRCLLTTWSLQTILVQKSKSRFYLSYPVTKDFVNILNFPLYVFLCLMSTYNCSSTHLRSFLLDGGVWAIIWVCSPFVSRFLLVDVPSFGWLKKDHTWEFQTTLFGKAVHGEPSQLNFEAIPRTKTPVLWALSGSIGSNRKSRLPARLVASENCAGHFMSSFITFV